MTEIRVARAADETALAAIDAATWSPDVTPAAKRPADAPFFTDRTSPGDVLVAVLDERVVGYVSLRQTMPLPSHRHVLEVSGLAVDPRFRGQGIGRRLVEAAEQEAGRRGARKLSLRVLGPNAVAQRLYETCGFRVEGRLRAEFLIEGRLVDDLLMALDLTRPSA
ncbi:MAG TPA: GNAT family N-acetyltransferase [Nocardioidaceae bacterium]|nr:GNAT family N-acetyltransferase [Nocardioidaceae bacterium]